MNVNKCPACDAQDTRPFRSDMKMCAVCGLVWERRQYSGVPVYDEFREQHIYGSGKEFLFRRCLGRLAEGFPGRGRLMDLGAAYGAFIGMAKADGWTAEGIEIDPKMSASALAAGLKVYNRPLEELGLPDASYDVVTVFEVLCLMEDPFKAVPEIYRVLKPGGRVYIREFNGAFHMALEGRRIFKILGLKPSVVHNFNFTAESLRRMLTGAGFKNVSIKNSPPTAGDPYGTGGRLSSLTGFAKKLYYCGTQALYFASFGRWLAGSSFIVEAEKQ